jgi:hypothetical protein
LARLVGLGDIMHADFIMEAMRQWLRGEIHIAPQAPEGLVRSTAGTAGADPSHNRRSARLLRSRRCDE